MTIPTEPLTFATTLAYLLAANAGVLIAWGSTSSSASAIVWARANERQRWRRISPAIRWILAVLWIIVLAAVTFFSVVALAAFPAVSTVPDGNVDGEDIPTGWVMLLGAVCLGVALGILAHAVIFARWSRRLTQRLQRDDEWDAWLGSQRAQRFRAMVTASWRVRLASFFGGLSVIVTGAPLIYEMLRLEGADPATRTAGEADRDLLLILVALAVVGLAGLLAVPLRPHIYLVDRALRVLHSDPEKLARGSRSIAPSRWRSKYHEAGFSISRHFRRCLPRLRRRLTFDQFTETSRLGTAVARRLQHSSVLAVDDEQARAELARATRIGVALVVSNDPVRVVESARGALPVPEDVTPEPPSRTRQVLEGAADTIERSWPSVRIILVLLLALALLATGQLEKIVDLLAP